MLFWNKPKPSGHVACTSELAATSGCGDQCGCREWPNPGDRHQAARTIVTCGERFDLSGDLGDALLKAGQIIEQIGQ